MFLRRDRRSGHRFVYWQMGLFFLAAGIWFGGLATDRPGVGGVVIGILLVGLILGMLGRRREGD